ncbi:MAG TPA: hypothetical protein P5572_13405, partial [Phycisphaerae bacterium]|nr:hypothetical protein [Phycisphaerae bacterium]
YENLAIGPDFNTNAWTQVDLGTTGLTVPDNVNGARITLIFTPNTGSNGEIFFDAAEATINGGSNVLLNPSFQTGVDTPEDWTVFETTTGSDQSYAVRSTFQIPGYPNQVFEACALAGGDNFAGFYQQISVSPGDTLNAHVQAYMRKTSKLEGASRAGLKIEWVGGTVPGQVDIAAEGAGANANTIVASSPVDTWIPLEIDFTMPPGTEAYPRMVAIVGAGGGTGAAYFDNMEMVVVNKFDGADANNDGAEDLYDFAQFQRCFNGDGAGDLGFNCTVFDNDEDIDVDLTDFEYFQPRLTGP